MSFIFYHLYDNNGEPWNTTYIPKVQTNKLIGEIRGFINEALHLGVISKANANRVILALHLSSACYCAFGNYTEYDSGQNADHLFASANKINTLNQKLCEFLHQKYGQDGICEILNNNLDLIAIEAANEGLANEKSLIDSVRVLQCLNINLTHSLIYGNYKVDMEKFEDDVNVTESILGQLARIETETPPDSDFAFKFSVLFEEIYKSS